MKKKIIKRRKNPISTKMKSYFSRLNIRRADTRSLFSSKKKETAASMAKLDRINVRKIESAGLVFVSFIPRKMKIKPSKRLPKTPERSKVANFLGSNGQKTLIVALNPLNTFV